MQGYGLGLPNANPYDPDIVVAGMYNRVNQVLEYAEKQSEKKGINLSNTDKFIIVALAQNGGGFDLNESIFVFKDKFEDWVQYPYLD